MNAPSKDQLDYVKSLLGVIWTGILAFGGLIVVCYCLSERFFPDGISFGDAFLLAYASVSFFIFVAIGVALGCVCAFWLLALVIFAGNRYCKKRGLPEVALIDGINDKLRIKSGASVVVTIFLAVVFMNLPDPVDVRLHKTAIFFFVIGFLGLCLFAVKAPQKRPEKTKYANWIVLSLLVAAETTVIQPALLNISMGLAGIRSFPADLVTVSDSAYYQILQMAKTSNLNIGFCKLENTDKWGTFDVRIVWNGVGTTSYVRLMDKNSGGKRTVLVPLKKDDVQMLRGDNVHLNCQ